MSRFFFHVLTAVLTFAVSLVVNSVWTSPNSVDKKLESAIYAVQMQNIERNCKTISPEKCEKFKKQIDYKRIAEWVKQDVINANQYCQEKNLSEAQCTARKKAAIVDIEENMLNQDSAKAEK